MTPKDIEKYVNVMKEIKLRTEVITAFNAGNAQALLAVHKGEHRLAV